MLAAWKTRGIYILLLVFLSISVTYSVVTPVMEASDELWHYPMVQYIADNWALPVQDPDNVGPWRQEGSQAPLYYVLSAALTWWIDTSDLEQVRWINPHADNGIIRQDGNTNLLVHTEAEAWPWQGTTLAIHLIRLLSVGMGAGTVYLTYLLALELWPGRWALALTAAGITAFNPMFCFISGAVNNDNLAVLLCSLALWLLVRALRRHSVQDAPMGSWIRDMVVLGIVLGLAVLTKSQSLGLLPLVALTVSFIAWRRRSWRLFGSGGAITGGLVAIIAGWWFVRNATLYDGDWMGIERFITILGYRVPPANLRQLWGERQGFMMAYWGLFGGVNIPMPQWIYAVLNGAALLSSVGLAGDAVWRMAHFRSWRRAVDWVRAAQVGLVALWPAIVAVLWAVWAVRTWSSQGRLVFAAIPVWSIAMSWGLSRLLPERWSPVLPGGVAAFMLVVAGWAPWGAIAPAYRPSLLPAGTDPSPQTVLRANMGDQLELLGYDIDQEIVQPGEVVRFTLYWESVGRMDRNWSIFCHLVDLDTELHVAVRDRYPGQGLLATSRMEPGLRWADEYAIRLPETTYAPSRLAVEIGLYDGDERSPISIEAGEGDLVDRAVRFRVLRVEPGSGLLPNPTRVNFEDQVALVGWQVSPRVVSPGASLELTLYWECLGSIKQPYTVSTQLVGDGLRKAAQQDLAPAGQDTSEWVVGQQVTDLRRLEVAGDAIPGGYDLVVSVYGWETPEELRRLRLVDRAGRVLPGDSVVLGGVRIVP